MWQKKNNIIENVKEEKNNYYNNYYNKNENKEKFNYYDNLKEIENENEEENDEIKNKEEIYEKQEVNNINEKDYYEKEYLENEKSASEEEEEEEEENEEKKLNITLINRKCSLNEHSQSDAINYCKECKIYLCNKCNNHHNEIFKMHHIINLNKNNEDIIFTGLCQEKNHFNKLDYFCNTHNQLCCSSCLCKIKSKGNGKHKDCDVCSIKKIKNQKKNKLIQNINFLEKLSKTIQQSIIELKQLFEKINKRKEEVKLNIQKVFTNIRNEINNREDIILSEVDKEFDKLFFNDEIINKSEKLPIKIKKSLEKGKIDDNDWKDKNKLSCLINDCINIENNIKDINTINEKIKKCNLNSEMKIKFSSDEKFIDKIKTFGEIYSYDDRNNKKTKSISKSKY